MSFKLAEAFVELRLDDEKLRAGLAQLQGLTAALDRSFESLLERSERVSSILGGASGPIAAPSMSPPIDLPHDAASDFSSGSGATADAGDLLERSDLATPTSEPPGSGAEFRLDTPVPPELQVGVQAPLPSPLPPVPPQFTLPGGEPAVLPSTAPIFEPSADSLPPAFAMSDESDRPPVATHANAPTLFEFPQPSASLERVVRDAIGLLRSIDGSPRPTSSRAPTNSDAEAALPLPPAVTTTSAAKDDTPRRPAAPLPLETDLAALRRALDDESLLEPLANRLDDWSQRHQQQAEQSEENLKKLLELATDTNTTLHRLEGRDRTAVFS